MIARKLLRVVPIVAVVVLVGMSAGAASPLNFRSYLSSSGNDANPCTLQQQCRLLPRALSMTVPGGEVWLLDSANYNTDQVLIAAPVSILAIPGAVGSFVAAGGGDALNINVPPGTTGGVNLDNLVIRPFGSSFNGGITLQSDTNLTVSHCKFIGPLNHAVQWFPAHKDSIFPPSGPGVVFQHSEISGANNGIVVSPGATGTEVANLTINDTVISSVSGNAIGFGSGGTLEMDGVHLIGSGSSLSGTGVEIATTGVTQIGAHISNSVIGGFNIGVQATQTAPTPHVGVSISGSVIKDSGTGTLSNGARILLDNDRIVNNGKGVGSSAISATVSTGNNTFDNNQTANDPFGTAPHN
ncbi:MAG TPA: hypothetical protein VJ891_10585 [Casimicrobiaceae bacterium]|nr:hypothetical protein [Casimicrobiaceae bacterium]